jgi:hypothetical protein
VDNRIYGDCEVVIREDLYNEKHAKIAAMLLKMAEITNMGVRRTAGFGMIKYIAPKENEETKIGSLKI